MGQERLLELEQNIKLGIGGLKKFTNEESVGYSRKKKEVAKNGKISVDGVKELRKMEGRS